MRPPFHIRLAIVATAALAAGLPAYAYVASHDLERTIREFSAGKPVTWPPAAKAGSDDSIADQPVAELVNSVLAALRLAGLVALALLALVLLMRAVRRRRRARELATHELRLGRDDLANPFRVQEAFEGIVGAISARWYQRLIAGQDHFTLEVHRLPDRSLRYTLALPRPLAPAVIGPLEDLYPDVRPIEVDGRPDWCTVGSAGGAWAVRHVLARLAWFPPAADIEPCMRFSRTRLPDVLHRWHSASRSPRPVGSWRDDGSVEVDQPEPVRRLVGDCLPAVSPAALVALGDEPREAV
jgi:hypothetical protein